MTNRAALVSGVSTPDWEVPDAAEFHIFLGYTRFPMDTSVRMRSIAALNPEEKVHGTEKMADKINFMATGLMKIMARGMPVLQRIAIGMMCDAIAGFWRVTFTVGEGKRYEKLMLEGLCLLERAFPSHRIHTMVFHYCVHIASHWRKFGPPRLCNCFVFERHIGAMVLAIQSRGLYVASSFLVHTSALLVALLLLHRPCTYPLYTACVWPCETSQRTYVRMCIRI